MSRRGRGLRPDEVIARVSAAIPRELRAHIVIVGSLATAVHLVQDRDEVRTKDIDCVVTPQLTAVANGTAVANRLLRAGWVHTREGGFATAGTPATPAESLPAVRLYPPGDQEWFLELLCEPASEHQTDREWARLRLADGDYGLPSFPFMGVATFGAVEHSSGLRVARPETMSLAHLLEHRAFADVAILGTEFDGRPMKRRNKDLGRVLAIAALSPSESIDGWASVWLDALRACFPSRWRELASTCGIGLRRLLASSTDLAEATHICNASLLAGRPRSMDELMAVGSRVLSFAVRELEDASRQDPPG